MSKQTITPGEWKAICFHDAAGNDRGPFIESINGSFVAECPATEQHCRGQRIANAKAIAAVPDMIEALRFFYDLGPNRDIAYNALRRAGQIE